jgi:hypothetical protein
MKLVSTNMYFMIMQVVIHATIIHFSILSNLSARKSLCVQHFLTIFSMASELHLVSCRRIIFGFSFMNFFQEAMLSFTIEASYIPGYDFHG